MRMMKVLTYMGVLLWDEGYGPIVMPIFGIPAVEKHFALLLALLESSSQKLQ